MDDVEGRIRVKERGFEMSPERKALWLEFERGLASTEPADWLNRVMDEHTYEEVRGSMEKVAAGLVEPGLTAFDWSGPERGGSRFQHRLKQGVERVASRYYLTLEGVMVLDNVFQAVPPWEMVQEGVMRGSNRWGDCVHATVAAKMILDNWGAESQIYFGSRVRHPFLTVNGRSRWEEVARIDITSKDEVRVKAMMPDEVNRDYRELYAGSEMLVRWMEKVGLVGVEIDEEKGKWRESVNNTLLMLNDLEAIADFLQEPSGSRRWLQSPEKARELMVAVLEKMIELGDTRGGRCAPKLGYYLVSELGHGNEAVWGVVDTMRQLDRAQGRG